MIEDKTWDTGITEMPGLVEFFRRRGVRASLADPRELSVSRGEICYRGRVIDVLYRNFELRDLLAIEDKGARLDALKTAFARNQVVSSLSGEFDHKSLWELFTAEQFSRLFSARQRALLARHIPWTRLVYERTTTDASGRRVDLPVYIARSRERLVMKPNRHCGGEGVSIGLEMTQRTWERLLHRVISEPREWVVQEWIDNTMKLLPWPTGRKGFRTAPVYTTYGFIATPQGFGAVGRVCTKRVVNIASGGALLSVFRLRE
jgi:diaminobutyrate-2-oxoglutarate transaminase